MSGIARRLADRYAPADSASSRCRRPGPTARCGQPAGGGRDAGRRDHDAVVEALRRASSLPDALVAQVRELIASGEPHTAASIAAALRKEPETAALGALASAIVSFHRGYVELAWHEFQECRATSGVATPRRSTCGPGSRSTGRPCSTRYDGCVAETPESVDARSWTDILGAVYGAGDEDLARGRLRGARPAGGRRQ